LVWHTPPRPPTAVCLERSALEWGPELDHVAKLLPWFGYLQKGHSAGKMRKTLGINGNHMRWCRSPKPSMGENPTTCWCYFDATLLNNRPRFLDTKLAETAVNSNSLDHFCPFATLQI
jgi:hypothetical protein